MKDKLLTFYSLYENHLSFYICNFRFIIEEDQCDPISFNVKFKITYLK